MPPKNSLTKSMLSISFESEFRSSNEESDQLSPPSGFSFTPQGYFVLSDDFNHRIQIYNGDQLIKSFGQKGKENGQFHYPKGIAVDANESIYVADSWNHRIQKFDSQGNHQKTFGSCGEGKNELNEPYDILIESSGNILVVERYNHRLQWFSPEGESLGWIGQRGTVLEERLAYYYETPASLLSTPVFEFPTSIDIDSQGNYYVTDSGNHRVMKFDKNWQSLLSFGERGGEAGQFQYPLCISIGQNDSLYVADLNNNRIQVFSPFGQFLGALDKINNSTPLKAPCLTAIDPQGNLIVGLTFNTRVFQFSLSSNSLESAAQEKHRADSKNSDWLILQGQLMEQSGECSKAIESYEQAIQFMCGENQEQSKKYFNANLILKFSNTVLQEKDPLKHEVILLKGFDIFSQQLSDSREEMLKVFDEWEKIAREENDKKFSKEQEVLEDLEDPRIFDQELFNLEKKDKILFRKIRTMSYKHCLLSNQFSEYINNIVSVQHSSALIQKGCNNLVERLNKLGNIFSSQLAIKEKNETEMVQTFSELQKNQSKWNIFLTNFLANSRIVLLFAPFLFELRTVLITLKCSAQAEIDSPEIGKALTQIIGEPPNNQIIPKILIGIQEIRSTHSFIDTLWRDLIDTWIALYGEHKKPLVRNPDMSYFSPLPFDIEDLDIEEVVRSYMMENTKLEKTSNGLVAGGEIYSVDSLPSNFIQQVSQVLESQTNYDNKNQELKEQLKDLHKQRRDLNQQLKLANPQDKKNSISINNNFFIVDFQIKLLLRMILTLEVNENNNINRLITGSAIAASNKSTALTPSTKSFFEILATYYLKEERCVELLSESIKKSNFQLSELKNQKADLNLKQNIENIDQSAKLDEETDDIQNRLENLEFDLIRHARIRNRLDRLFDFLKQTGTYNKERSVFDLVPAFGNSLTRTGPTPATLSYPMGLAFDSDGTLLYVDQNNHHVYRITQTGKYLAKFGGWGNSPGFFQYPVSLQLDRQSNIYVVDMMNQRVQKFWPDGTFVFEFGNNAKEDDQLGIVFSSSIDDDDNLWIADTSHQRIQIYGPDGNFIRSVSPTSLNQPIGICCLKNGEYLIADRSNDLIKRYNSNGTLLASLKRAGTGFGDLYIMRFSPIYGIFASDHWSSRILHLDPALNIQGIYGNSGRRTGQFNRIGWMDIYKDLLAVADMRNHRIQIFDIKKTFSS